MSVTVMSYNIRHCLGRDMRVNIERVAEVIEVQKPDVVCLQEVYDFRFWGERYRQPDTLGKLLGMTAIFDATMSFGGFAAGNLMLVRGEFERLTPIRLPSFGEPRLCQQVDVATQQGVLRVLNTHLGLTSTERQRQLQTVAQHVPTDTPVVVCGDFNTNPDTVSNHLPSLQVSITDGFTFPSRNPRKTLDNVLVSEHCTVTGANVVPSNASDHIPVSIILSFLKSDDGS